MNPTHIIKHPIITESSLKDASNSVFTFAVAKSANKDQISQAISNIYKVEVVKITTTTTPGKTYRFGKKRQEKKSPPGKKARIQLKAGQKIDLFEIEESK